MLWIIVVIGLAIDQLSKYIVLTKMDYLQSITVIPKLLDLTFVMNDGAAFSILQGKVPVFIIITFVFVAALIIFYYRQPKEEKLLRFWLSVLCAGALGNLIDRIRFGKVVDFFDLHIWPIFNFADMMVVFSVIAIAILIIFPQKIKKGHKHDL